MLDNKFVSFGDEVDVDGTPTATGGNHIFLSNTGATNATAIENFRITPTEVKSSRDFKVSDLWEYKSSLVVSNIQISYDI